MGETIIEKIIRHNTGKAVKPGDIVTVNVDRCMIHDIFIPFVADKFEEMGFTKPVSYTHLTLPTTTFGCRSRWSPYH